MPDENHKAHSAYSLLCEWSVRNWSDLGPAGSSQRPLAHASKDNRSGSEPAWKPARSPSKVSPLGGPGAVQERDDETESRRLGENESMKSLSPSLSLYIYIYIHTHLEPE